MNLRTITAIAFSLVACIGGAQAARPLQTDDAGVLAKGDCEVEGATQRLSAAGEAASESSLQLGCGVGGDSQLALAAALARADGVRESGLVVSGKTGLWKTPDPDDATSLALSWLLQAAQPPGGAWRHVGTGLNLLWTLPVATAYSFHANLGHNRKGLDKRQSTTWGLGFEHAGLGAQRRWMPMAELFGDDRERPWWNLGLRFAAVPEKLFVALSFGRQFGTERPTLVTFSLRSSL
jgi:hypothetical protein